MHLPPRIHRKNYTLLFNLWVYRLTILLYITLSYPLSFHIQRKQLLGWGRTFRYLCFPWISEVVRYLWQPITHLPHSFPLSSKNIFKDNLIRNFSLSSTELLAASFCFVNIDIGWASTQLWNSLLVTGSVFGKALIIALGNMKLNPFPPR